MKLIFEKSVPQRTGVRISKSDVPVSVNIKPELLRQKPAELPELSELDVVVTFKSVFVVPKIIAD